MYNTETEIPKDGRREELTTEERKEFKKLVKSFPTRQAAVKALGMNKNTIERVMLVGSGHPDTIDTIRKQLEARKVA